MKYSIIILLLLAVLMAISNPKLDQHENEIQKYVADKNSISSMLGAGFLSSKIVDYKNYLVLSTTHYKGDWVTIGVFSNVWVISGNVLTK